MLRVIASRGELWLDELWSLKRACTVGHAWQVITALHHDNNHYLTSLWMWLLGENSDWWIYRIPSIIAGTAGIFIAARIGRRQSTTSGIAAALLISLSYLFVLYSSEARGYAIACCMGLAAYDFMELYLRGREWRYLLGYGLLMVIGVLGSLTLVSAAVAFGIWSGVVLLWRERTRRGAMQFAALHALPAAAVAVLWWVDIRKIEIGGGPVLQLWAVLREAAGNALGFPSTSGSGNILLIGVIFFIGWQIVRLARAADARWAFFAAILVLAPAALVFKTGRANQLYPRYFLVNVCFFYLLVAMACGGVGNRGRYRRQIGGALTVIAVIWLAANTVLSVELCQVGRGHYKEALEFIAVNTPGGRPQIGSNQKLRSETLIGYYGKYLPEDKRPVIVPVEVMGRVRPQWILTTDSPYEVERARPILRVGPGLSYGLKREFGSVTLSGFPARIYERD